MAESNLLALPAQAKSHPVPNTDNPLYELRRKRAIALVPTVRAVEGGFRVSSSCREIRYLVTQPNGHRVCTCPDFLNHEAEVGFRCKHIWAVEMALEAGLFPEATNGNGNGHAPAATPAILPEPSKAFPASLSVLHRYLSGEDPVRIKLIKNTKGYSWEIAVAERNPEAALSVLQELEQKVKDAFGDRQAEG
jgi:hypothetical protein